MANVKFSRKIFEKEVGKLTESMQEKIALFGTPVESLDDEILELEIFPNRPDLLSYSGFRRSFLAFLGKKVGFKNVPLHRPEKEFEVYVDSSVKDVRPFTICAIVKKLKLDDEKIKEIIEIQEKLHSTIGRQRKKLAIGIYPLEKISLPITYKAMEPDKIKFQPLDSPREMSGLEILQRHPTGKEYASLLAGKVKFPVFVDKDDNVLSMPPIINSEKTGRVTTKTHSVFIECSGFDVLALEKCMKILVATFSEMGGKIFQMKVKDGVTPEMKPEKMKISIKKAEKLLGIELNEKQMKVLLEKMGYNYKDGEVEIPPWRADILHEVDLIEDIAIAYGYENFDFLVPEIATTGKENSDEILKRKISKILVGLGLLEVSNYHLTKKDDQFAKMGFGEKEEKGFVEISGSKTDYNIMRKDLSHYVLKIVSENSDSEYPQKFFEVGKVFGLDDDGISEEERLSVAFTPGNFTDVGQILEFLFSNLGLEIKIKEPENAFMPFVVGRVGEIFLDDDKIGFVGEVHPNVLKNWKIKMPVSLFEIQLKKVFEKFK